MQQEQAIKVLISAVRLAQAKGAFTLEEAKLIATAVEAFVKDEPASKVEDKPEEEKKVEEEKMDDN